MGQSLRDKGSAVGPPGPLMFKIDRINEIQIDAHPLRPQQHINPHQSREEEHSAAAATSPWCPSLFLSGRSAAERAPIAKHLLGLECLPEHLLNQLKQEGTASSAGPQTAARTDSRFSVVENSLQVTFSSSEAPSLAPSSSTFATLGNEEGSFPPPPGVWSPFLKRLVVVAAATIELPLSRYPIAPPRCPASSSIDTWDGVAVTVEASHSRGRQQSATRSGKQVDEPTVLREEAGAGPQRTQLRALHCVLYPVELSSTTATTTSHSHKNNNNCSSGTSRGGGSAATPRSLPSRQANGSTSSVSSLASSKGSHANAPITATASPDGGSSSLRQQWLATIREHENRFHRSLRRVEAELNATTASPAATSAPTHHNPPQELPPTTASPASTTAAVIHIGVPVYYLRLPFQDNGSQRMGDALWAEYVQLSSLVGSSSSSSSPTTSADNFLRTLLSSGSTYAAAAPQRPLRVAEYPLFWLLDRLHPSCCSSLSSSSTSAVEGKEEKEVEKASEDDDEGGLLWRHNERLATILHRCFLQTRSHKTVVEPALATATTAPPPSSPPPPHKRLPRGAGVLIHCQLGVSRSATIVVAYLLIHFVTYQLGMVVGRRCRRSRTSAAIGDVAVATAPPLPTSTVSDSTNNNNNNRPATEGSVGEAAFAHATATPPPTSWDPLLGHNNYAIESSGPVSSQPLPLLSLPDVGEHGDDDATSEDKRPKQEDLLDVAPPSLAKMLALVRAARPRVAPNPCFGAELAKLERCLLPFLL